MNCHHCNWVGTGATHCPECFRFLAESIKGTPAPASAPAALILPETYFEHVSEAGFTTGSRRKLAAVCKDLNLRSKLLDG